MCQVKSLPGVGDLASDELLHDLVGSSVDGLDARVNVVLANVVLPHVSPAAVELDAVPGNNILKVASHPLGHRSSLGVELLVEVEGSAVIDESSRDTDVAFHLRQLIANCLHVGQRPSKSLSLLDALTSCFVASLGSRHPGRSWGSSVMRDMKLLLSSPRSADLGTLISSKKSSAVSWAFIPIFFSCNKRSDEKRGKQ